MELIILKVVSTLLLTFLAGVLYRLGGAAKTGKWYDFLCNTKARDFGIPTVAILLYCCWVFPSFHWYDLSLILTWGAIFGTQTTYWKKKGQDAKWYNWLFTGLGYSIAWLPTVLAHVFLAREGLHVHLLGFGIRTFICTAGTVFFSELFDNVVYEENARGEVEVLTIPLLFIG